MLGRGEDGKRRLALLLRADCKVCLDCVYEKDGLKEEEEEEVEEEEEEEARPEEEEAERNKALPCLANVVLDIDLIFVRSCCSLPQLSSSSSSSPLSSLLPSSS